MTAVARGPPPVVRRDYDADVAAIFAEEATELLEAAQAAMQSWNSGGKADDIDALKRPLHTLKGGARMAGVTSAVPPDPPAEIRPPRSVRDVTKRRNASVIAAMADPRSPVKTAAVPSG